MSDLIKIAVDAMGGDGSPKKIIEGIIHNHKLNKKKFFKIFGNEIEIRPLIKNRLNENFFEIVHTENVFDNYSTLLPLNDNIKLTNLNNKIVKFVE